MKLRVLDAADFEVEAAFDYYEDQDAGLGFRATDEVVFVAFFHQQSDPKKWRDLLKRG